MNQYLRRKIWTLNRSGKFRGYLRTVSGYPVTLTDCIAGQPVSLAVDGNAVQDGTPTPDDPVEVIGTGDKILPVGYTSISYIEGTGTQWIDTDFCANQDSGMYLVANVTEIIDTDIGAAPNRFAGSVNNNFAIGYSTINDEYRFILQRKLGIDYDANVIPFPDTLDTHIHTFKNNFLNDHKLWVDDISRDSSDWTFSNYSGIAIFRTALGRANSYYSTPIKARIYHFKFSQGTDIIADLYPAIRDDDGKVGMYDVINDEFYTNSGTGEFIAGSNIAPAYKVPVTAQGRNLFDEEDFLLRRGVSIDDKGFIVIKNSEYLVYDIEVKPGIDYTISIITDDRRVPIVRYLDANKSELSSNYMYPYYMPYVFGVGHKVRYVRIVGTWSSVSDVAFKNFMLIEGAYTAETIPAYEPYREPQTFNIYTPQQLAKVGDTADTVVLDFDSNTAKLVNAVGIDDLSALSLNAAWNDVCIFDCKQPQYRMIQGSSGICNRFVCRGGWENTEKVAITNTYFRLFIAKTRIGYTEEDTSDTLVQKANDWLSENETYGLYSIATPITTDITALQDWDAMPSLWSGTAEITADTVIAPSAITAKYYASKPEEVN